MESNTSSILRIRLDKTARAGTSVKHRFCNIDCLWCHHDYFEHNGSHFAKSNSDLVEAIARVLDATGAEALIVRLAGDGDPTIVGSEELAELISQLHRLPVPVTVKLTTNGIKLPQMAVALKEAGLDSVTVSLNSLSPHLYQFYAGSDGLHAALRGIDAAFRTGIPVKVNAIYCRLNHHELDGFIALSRRHNNMLIKYFDLLVDDRITRRLYLPLDELENRLEPMSEEVTVFHQPYARKVFRIVGGGQIEVKTAGEINNCPNTACTVRNLCLEGCRMSVRIGLGGIMQPCGIRKDNVVDLFDPETNRERIQASLYSGGKLLLRP